MKDNNQYCISEYLLHSKENEIYINLEVYHYVVEIVSSKHLIEGNEKYNITV